MLQQWVFKWSAQPKKSSEQIPKKHNKSLCQGGQIIHISPYLAHVTIDRR